MIGIYCRRRHGSGASLCRDCEKLAVYAQRRIRLCPLGSAKPVCSKCKIHCYIAQRREEIRDVMRYSGPRMALRHPILAFAHLSDSVKSKSDRR